MLELTGFVVFNIAFGTAFILGVGFIPEPMRRQFMIVLLAFEFGCYWQGGLGILLYPFTAVGLISAVVGFG